MSDDPWVMYYVVRSGVPFSLEQAMASAGAAAVACVERFGPFDEWHERPRKVALRAGEAEFAQIESEERARAPRHSAARPQGGEPEFRQQARNPRPDSGTSPRGSGNSGKKQHRPRDRRGGPRPSRPRPH